MGYGYTFWLTVDKPEEFEVYEQQAIALHEELKEATWFPEFGSSDSSGSRGYGCGPTEHLLPEFIKFTSAFPDFVFKLWMSYWDDSILYMVEVHNTTKISENTFNGECVDIMPGCQASYCFKDNLSLDNNITGLFE